MGRKKSGISRGHIVLTHQVDLGEQSPEHISFAVHPETRAKIVALSYLWGFNGAYAKVAREIMDREIKRVVAVELDPEEVLEFERILEAVHAGQLISQQKRAERSRLERERREAAFLQRETAYLDQVISAKNEQQVPPIAGEQEQKLPPADN